MPFQADTVVVACIVAVIAPSILAIGNSRIQDKKQEKQWARDDELERRRIERENLRTNETQSMLNENNKKLQDIEDETKVIHSLVNSELTRAYENDLAAVIESKESLQKLIKVTKKLGGVPDDIDFRELKVKDARIRELQHIISERNLSQAIIDERLSKKDFEEPV